MSQEPDRALVRSMILVGAVSAVALGFLQPTRAVAVDDREGQEIRTGGRLGAPVPSPGSWQIGTTIAKVVHAFDLPGTHNRLLLCAGSGNDRDWEQRHQYLCYRYNRNKGRVTTFSTPTDWFCNAAVHLSDGKILIAGGTGPDGYRDADHPFYSGAPETYTYAPDSGEITRLGDALPAWYPGLLEDHEGGVYKHGGTHDGTAIATWEYLPRGSTTWNRLPWSWATRFYSDIRLIRPGTAAYTGASSWPSLNRPPSILDLTTGRRTTTPGLRKPTLRKAAASVLLYPAQDQRVLIIGGGGQDDPAISEVDSIDYRTWPESVPTFSPRAALPQPTMLALSALLPNGQLFVTGGTTEWRGTSVRWAAIYDQRDDAWIPVATPTVPRNYHSTIMTGLDGRVSTFGGNPRDGSFEDREEIYSPWYTELPRPAIEAFPRRMAYGAQYAVQVAMPQGATAGYITLERARADTHLYVPNQAMADLPFTVSTTGELSVQVPSDPALLPPGYYKMAVNTTDRVPSKQVWVRIG